MKFNTIYETVQDQLDAISSRYGTDAKTIRSAIDQSCVHPKDFQFVLRLWYNKLIELPNDNDEVRNVLEKYHSVRNLMQNKDLLSYKTIEDLRNAVEPLVGNVSKRKGGLRLDPANLPGVDVFARRGEFTVYEISESSSLAKMGEGTQWCTRKSYPQCRADDYIYDFNSIFQIWQGNKPIAQFTPTYSEIMNQDDDRITLEWAVDIVPNILDNPDADLRPLLNYMLKVYMRPSIEYEQRVVQLFEMLYRTFSANNARSQIFVHCEEMMLYVQRYRKNGVIKELEDFFAQYDSASLLYAVAMNQRFLKGEPEIIKHMRVATIRDYVTYVTRGERWPELEDAFRLFFIDGTTKHLGHIESPQQIYSSFAEYCILSEIRMEDCEPMFVKLTPIETLFKYFKYVVVDDWPLLLQKIDQFVPEVKARYEHEYYKLLASF